MTIVNLPQAAAIYSGCYYVLINCFPRHFLLRGHLEIQVILGPTVKLVEMFLYILPVSQIPKHHSLQKLALILVLDRGDYLVGDHHLLAYSQTHCPYPEVAEELYCLKNLEYDCPDLLQ